MTHYVKVDGKDVKIEMGCTNPDLENNSCRFSDKCDKCRYGEASMSIEDDFALMKAANAKRA